MRYPTQKARRAATNTIVAPGMILISAAVRFTLSAVVATRNKTNCCKVLSTTRPLIWGFFSERRINCLAEKAIVANGNDASEQRNDSKRIRLDGISEATADVDQARAARPKLVSASNSDDHGGDAACGSDTHDLLISYH